MSEPPVDQIPKTLEEAVDASDDPAARLEPGWRLLERARALGQQADDDPQRAKVAEYVGALGELAVEMAAGEGEE